jgi:uncharacterized protein with PQ loop repeat
MHAATEVIGMMASLTSFLIWLPQGARVWRHRRDPAQLHGIVLSTQVLSLTGNVLWGVYAVLIGSFWLGAPSLVNAPIAVATLVIVGRAGRAERAERAGLRIAHPTTAELRVVQDAATGLSTVLPTTAELRVVQDAAIGLSTVLPSTAELRVVRPRTAELRVVDAAAFAVA